VVVSLEVPTLVVSVCVVVFVGVISFGTCCESLDEMDSRSVPATIVGFGLVGGDELSLLQLISRNRSRVAYINDWASRFHMLYERSLILDLVVIRYFSGLGICTGRGNEIVSLRFRAQLDVVYFLF
jgi:hypothetical protein